MMVGLPGSGKSHWARTHMRQYPDKQYRLLGTEELLACMIVRINAGFLRLFFLSHMHRKAVTMMFSFWPNQIPKCLVCV